jgi:ribosomal protein L6P/L9E
MCYSLPQGVFFGVSRRQKLMLFSINKSLLNFVVSSVCRLKQINAYSGKGLKLFSQFFRAKPGKVRLR